jgi:predicted amino acid racemase
MAGPYLTIDLDKIEHNARAVVELCAAHGIDVVGVTKGVCGHPAVARAMLRGGVAAIGDSQLENIGRMRAAGIQTSYALLRVPPLSGAEDVVAAVDLSLNSELTVLQALSAAAARRGRVHQVIVMVEIGDLREGVLPGDVVPLLRAALELPGIRVVGLGANLACFAGVVPTAENMGTLVGLAGEVERRLGLTLRWLSGINSSGLELIRSGRLPRAVNHARIGEAILLGRETTERRPWPETAQDAFRLHAEVLEVKRKPSLPAGPRAEDAFGRRPAFEDRGEMLRALLNVGREGIDPEQLTPVDPGIAVLGASSGYLVVDVTAAPRTVRVGDELAFWPGYGALVAAMTSEYVDKRVWRGGALLRDPGGAA